MDGSNEQRKGFNMPEKGFALAFVIFLMLWALPECGKPGKTESGSLKTEAGTKTEGNKSWLYIAQDSLNMREAPHLDSMILEKIPYGAMVEFMGKRTRFRQKITLDKKIYEEPWVQVRTAEGTLGWVYAGGVRFYPLEAND